MTMMPRPRLVSPRTLARVFPTVTVLAFISACSNPSPPSTAATPSAPGPLHLVSATPADGASAVAIGTSISVTFDRTVRAASLDPASFQLLGPGGGAIPALRSASGTVATLTPAAPLAYSTAYEVLVTSAILAEDGGVLEANRTWNFTTAAEQIPAAQIPAAPSGVTATAGDGQMAVTWQPVATATSYDVYWSTSTAVSPNAFQGTATSTGSSATIPTLQDGIHYWAVVTARNGAGSSGPSTRVGAVPLASGDGPFFARVTRTGGGQVSGGAIACGTACAAEVVKGSTLLLSAAPDPNSVFVGWNGDCTGTGPCTLTMDGEKWVSATFTSCPGSLGAPMSLAGPGDQRVTAAAVAADGSVYVAGKFTGALGASFGGLVAAGGTDAFVARYAADGTRAWVVRLGGVWLDEALGLALLPDGGVAIVGRFEGTATFGGTSLTSGGSFDGFVARLGPDGAVSWARRLGGQYQDAVRAVAADSAGDVYVTGDFYGSLDLGGIVLASAGYQDMFVARLAAADGATVWAASGGGTGYDQGRAIAIDPGSGDVVTAGVFAPNAVIAGTTLAGFPSSPSAVYVARYGGADGTPRWALQLGDTQSDDAAAVAIDAGGDALVGWTSGYLATFGGPFSIGAGLPYVTRIAPDGTVRSTQGLGNASGKVLHALAIDASGDLLVGGAFVGNVEFGGPPHYGAASTTDRQDVDAWVARLAPDGTLRWSERLGEAGPDEVLSVAAHGEVRVVGGYVSPAARACSGAFPASGGTDAFFAPMALDLAPPVSSGTLLEPAVPSPWSPGPARCTAPAPPTARGAVGSVPAFTAIPVDAPILTFGFSAAVADFNGDGVEDALVLDSQATQGASSLYVWTNAGDGTLTAKPLPAATGILLDGPLDVLPLDAQSDGRADAFVVQAGYDAFPWPGALNLLFLQDASGALVDATLAKLPLSPAAYFNAVIGDPDCDGAPDIYTLNQYYQNDGTGTFRDELAQRIPPNLSATALAFCDVNRDGAPDLVLGDTGGANPTRILLNDGRARFTVSNATLPPKHFSHSQVQEIVCADLDGDGWNDLVMVEANLDAQGVQIDYWHNNGDGSFEDRTATDLPQTDMAARWLVVTDLNGDGWPDLVASGGACGAAFPPSDHQVFLNRGGTFEEHTDLLPGSAPGCSRIYPFRPAPGGPPGLLRLRRGNASAVLVRTSP
jgi:hypothetical protein